MSATFICLACSKEKPVSARSGKQNYCSLRACRNASKAAWKQRHLAEDPDYRENQRSCYEDWCRRNPGYWANYRHKNPEQAERNREKQRERNRRRPRKRSAKPDPDVIAKVDSIPDIPLKSLKTGEYWLIPGEAELIAKVDTINALKVKLVVISGT